MANERNPSDQNDDAALLNEEEIVGRSDGDDDDEFEDVEDEDEVDEGE